VDFKPNSTLQNQLLRWDLHPLIYYKFALSLIIDVGFPTGPNVLKLACASSKINFDKRLVVTTHVPRGLWMEEIFTKGLYHDKFQDLLGKLRMIDIHLPIWRVVLYIEDY